MAKSPSNLRNGLGSLIGGHDEKLNALMDRDRIEIAALHGTEEDKRLVAFARKRGMILTGVNWRLSVFMAAARDNPEIGRKPDFRGRPKKPTGGFAKLFAKPSDTEKLARALLDEVDEINGEERRTGSRRLTTDRDVIRRWVADEKALKPGSELYASQVQQLANRVSALRKALGRPRRRKIIIVK